MTYDIFYSKIRGCNESTLVKSVEVHSVMDECTKLKAENDQLRDALAILTKSTILGSCDRESESLLWGHDFCHWLKEFEYSRSFIGAESVVKVVRKALGFKV